jgi:hypothetical protein
MNVRDLRVSYNIFFVVENHPMNALTNDVIAYLNSCEENNQPASLIFVLNWTKHNSQWTDAHALEQWFSQWIGHSDKFAIKVLNMALTATFVVETQASYFKTRLNEHSIEYFRSIQVNNSTDTDRLQSL